VNNSLALYGDFANRLKASAFLELRVVMEKNSCSPRFKDPVELIDLRDLSSFRCNSGWQKYDALEVDTLFFPTYAEVVDDETLKPEISINGTKIQITHTNLGEFLEGGLVGLIYGDHDLSDVTQKYCPFCASPMSSGDFLEEGEPTGLFFDFGIGDEIATFRFLEYCFSCHYWRFQDAYFYQGAAKLYHLIYTSFLSKIREFSDQLPEGFVFEVAQWVKKNPEMWHTMSAISFEKLVAAIFRANYQDAEIFHVGQPDDGGKDVIFIDSGKRQWLIQAKRRMKPGVAEPIETLRNLLGTMSIEGSQYGIIASTADHFTYRAYEVANRVKEKGILIKLLDKGKLSRMLENVVSMERPWYALLKEDYPDIAEYFSKQIPSRQYRQLELPL
jgi:hypothetical protein